MYAYLYTTYRTYPMFNSLFIPFDPSPGRSLASWVRMAMHPAVAQVAEVQPLGDRRGDPGEHVRTSYAYANNICVHA